MQPTSPSISTDSHCTASSQGGERSFRQDRDPGSAPQSGPEDAPSTPSFQYSASIRRRPGTTTPWDPQNLAVQREQELGPDRATLARNLRHILGEFPVDNGKRTEESGENRSKGVQEPLWLLSGLADRGWDLDDPRSGEAGSNPAQRTLGESPVHAGLEHLLRKWTPEALREVEMEQRRYFKHGMFASKCDVAPALDPINHGIITEPRADELFKSYWNTIHPQWSLLDPALHTVTLVRQRSALLTTTILAIGATAILSTSHAACQDHITEALRLHAHVEKLSLVVYATGARSIDIVQAQILLSRWGTAPRSRMEEQRWMRAAMIPRMATEIGITRSRPLRQEDDVIKLSQLRRNDLRTRVFLMINEYRFSTYNGRQALDLTHLELGEEELKEIEEKPPSGLERAPPVALYDLFLFDREARQRLSGDHTGRHSSLLNAELEHIRAYIEGWIQDWCPTGVVSSVTWYLVHEALSCWLLLVTYVAKIRLQRPCQQRQQHQQYQQQLMSNITLRLFTEALKVPHAVCVTQRAAIFPFAASILLRLNPRPDLVLQVALRMAGEPGEPRVPTFVRESGIQMLLILNRNNFNNTTTSGVEDKGKNQVQSCEESNDTSAQAHHSSTHLEQINLSAHTDDTAPSFNPDLWLNGTSLLQPSASEGMFSFNVDDFPNIPDFFSPQNELKESLNRYYEFGDLDQLIGISDHHNLPQANSMPTQMGVLQPSPNDNSMPSYSSLNTGFEVPIEENVHEAGLNWAMEGISPSSMGICSSHNDISGEDRNAQRSYILSSANKLIQLASRI